MVIGVITARGGSKGIPGKNMVDLGGRPLIDYTYSFAAQARTLGRLFLSTDVPAAIALARSHYPRIEVPYVRPAELCGDDASLVDVVLHLLDYLESSEGFVPSSLVLLQPTSPFRRLTELDQAVARVGRGGCESIVGVTRVIHHPADYLYRRRPDDRTFNWVMRDPAWRRRQDFPEILFNTGALYACTTSFLRNHRRFYDEASDLAVLSDESALDIDTAFDLQLARRWLAVANCP